MKKFAQCNDMWSISKKICASRRKLLYQRLIVLDSTKVKEVTEEQCIASISIVCCSNLHQTFLHFMLALHSENSFITHLKATYHFWETVIEYDFGNKKSLSLKMSLV